MATSGSMNFSVVFTAVTSAFNSGVTAAKNNFTAAATAMTDATKGLTTGATSADKSIYGLLNLRTAGSTKKEIDAINASLDNFRKHSKAPAEELERVTKAAQQQIASLREGVSSTVAPTQSLAASARGIAGGFAGLVGVTVGLAAVKEGVESVLAATMRYEATIKQLEYSTGSAQKAAAEYEYLAGVANRLGLDLNGAAESYGKLASATKGTALEGAATRAVFEGLAAAAATMNLSVDETNGAMLALSQMVSKGKVSMEELRGQLGERLPGAMALAAKALGRTTAELEAMVEKGVDSVQFLKVFGPAMLEAFGDNAANNAQTLRGQINLLGNDFERFLQKLGAGGVTGAAVKVLADMREGLQRIQRAMDSLDPKTFLAIKQAAGQAYDTVRSFLETVMSTVGAAVGEFGKLVSAVSATVRGIAGLGNSADEVSFLTRTIQGLAVTFGVLNDGVKGIEVLFTAALGTVQSFFGGIATGLSKITFGDMARELAAFGDAMNTAAGDNWEAAKQKALDFQSSAVAAADAAISAQGKVAESAKAAGDAGSKAQEGVADAAGRTAMAVSGVAAAQGTAAAAATQALASTGEAAGKALNTIALSAAPGQEALLKIASSGAAVAAAFQDLASKSGVSLPLVKMEATQLAAVMAEVAVKSSDAARALGQNLKAAIDGLKGSDLTTMWTDYVNGLVNAGASTQLLADTTRTFADVAMKTFGADLSGSLTVTTTAFNEQLAVLSKMRTSVDELKASGVDAGAAMSAALTAMTDKARSPVELQQLINQWKSLGQEGLITGQQMAEGLEKARTKLDDVRPGVNSLSEALRTLGQQGNEAADLTAGKYAAAFQVLGSSGATTYKQLTAGIQTMMSAADDPGALYRLRDAIIDFGVRGKLSTGEVAQGLADVRNKIDGLRPGINSSAEAFKAFGMASREESEAMAERYGEAFAVLQASGIATANELQTAFRAYAEAAVNANDGYVDGAIAAQGAALGLSVTADETGKVIIRAMDEATSATERGVSASGRAAEGYRQAGNAAEAASEQAIAAKEREMNTLQRQIDMENRQEGRDRSGFSVNKQTGQTVAAGGQTWLSIYNMLKQMGVDNDTRAREIAREFTDEKGNVDYFASAGQLKYGAYGGTIEQAIAAAAQGFVMNEQGQGARRPQHPRDEPRKTVNVNLKDPSGKKVGVSVPDGDESRFLDILTNSRSVA